MLVLPEVGSRGRRHVLVFFRKEEAELSDGALLGVGAVEAIADDVLTIASSKRLGVRLNWIGGADHAAPGGDGTLALQLHRQHRRRCDVPNQCGQEGFALVLPVEVKGLRLRQHRQGGSPDLQIRLLQLGEHRALMT
jgi:hypothetical protein